MTQLNLVIHSFTKMQACIISNTVTKGTKWSNATKDFEHNMVTDGRPNFPGLLSSLITDHLRNTNGLKTTQQRVVDRVLVTWTTRQESTLPQTESQNKDCGQWRSLCAQAVLMDVGGSHGPALSLLTDSLFCISEQIISFSAFLWSWDLSGCGWVDVWMINCPQSWPQLSSCVTLVSYSTLFIPIVPRTKGSSHKCRHNKPSTAWL